VNDFFFTPLCSLDSVSITEHNGVKKNHSQEGNSITMKLPKVYSGEQVISQPRKKTPCD